MPKGVRVRVSPPAPTIGKYTIARRPARVTTIMTNPGFIKLKNKFFTPEYFPEEATYVFKPGRDFRDLKLDYNDVGSYMLGMWTVKDHLTIRNQIISVIPDRYREDFTVNCLRVPHGVPPHIDVERKCAINFYVETSGCITRVFDIKSDSRPKSSLPKYKYMFMLKDLTEIGSFVSTNGDAYLLDTSKPHQVVTTQPATDRKLLSLTSKYSFAEVRDMLSETGAI